ncbi:MAG TPA: GGDEF domain-containing protein [Dyella sp.]|nr:GGDEF domain-containing protein [Dyella sp.]
MPHIALSARETAITDPGAFLDQTEKMRIKDHARFADRLAQIHRQMPPLTAAQKWQLDYLDAQEASLQGNYDAANPPLQNVINHSGNRTLAAKASALLMNNLAMRHRYQEAFTLAQRLSENVPNLQDAATRLSVLTNLSQMLNLAGQNDLAIQYARMAEQSVPEGTKPCRPRFMLMAALYSAKKLTSSAPDLSKTTKLCEEAGQPIFVVATQLILSTLYLEEHQPTKALALLDRLDPLLKINRYFPHTLSAATQRAQAYEQLGRDKDAKTAALAVLDMTRPGTIDNMLIDVYQLLYRIAERHGDTADALRYYKEYINQKQSALDDASAQALAYQAVQQQVLTRKLEIEELGRQNSVLKLQQALSAKAVETSRLYIALLLIGLGGVALWLFRTMRSQRRFKRMATRDGLTDIFNHQHFMSECEKRLQALQKRAGHACLIWIDLDHFKRINDTHGHAIGDAALRHSVAICQQQLRPDDLIGRLGGEEFGILLGDCPREQAIAIADRIRLAIEASPMVLDEAVVSISASIGVANTATSGHDLQRLCRDADAALYRAKHAGRNRVVADAAGSNLAEA